MTNRIGTGHDVDRGFRHELARKLIHVSTVGVPLALWVLPRAAALLLLGAAVAVALSVEWARHHLRWARYHFLRRTRRLLRPSETEGLSGATNMAIGYFVAALLFPRSVAVAAMLFNAFGDGAAGLVGRRWGRRRTRWGKSWEGWAAGLLVNCTIGMMIPGISPGAAVVGGIAAATIEFVPIPIDDNLSVPIGGGAALLLAAAGLP